MSERRARLTEWNLKGTQALLKARFEKAALLYEAAIQELTRDDDDLAAALYENLGLAYLNQGRFRPALRAFLRALDGQTQRPQSLCYAITCLVNDAKFATARVLLGTYLERYGEHPQGWTVAHIEQLLDADRDRLAKAFGC